MAHESEPLIEDVAGLSCALSRRRDGEAILLLHGWGCDHKFLAPQFSHFSELGWMVVAPDLPGHGMSAGITAFSLEDMTACLKRALLTLDVGSAVVIGHSMGGALALELSHVAPQTIKGVALIDTVLWPDVELKGAIDLVEHHLRAGDLQTALELSVQALFLPSDDPFVRQMFCNAFTLTSPAALIGSFHSAVANYNADAASKILDVPIAYIAAEHPLAPVSLLRSKFKHMQTGKIIGSGHFAPLLVKDQINAMLETFVNSAGKQQGKS